VAFADSALVDRSCRHLSRSQAQGGTPGILLDRLSPTDTTKPTPVQTTIQVVPYLLIITSMVVWTSVGFVMPLDEAIRRGIRGIIDREAYQPH
jgi:hypothetical protein